MIERAGYQDLIDSCYVISERHRLGLEVRSLKLINTFQTSFKKNEDKVLRVRASVEN